MSVNKKLFIALCVAIVVVYGGFVFFLASVARDSGANIAEAFPVVGSDSLEYATLAVNIFEHGIFSRSYEAPYVADTFRTPGYPFVAGLLFSFTKNWYVVILFQILLVIVSAVLVYEIARHVLGSRWAIAPAVLFAFDPTTLLNASLVLSDTLFVALLLATVYVLFVRPAGIRRYVVAGVLIALCAYVRPIGMYLPFVLFPAALLVHRTPWKQWLQKSLIAIGIVCLLMFPWVFRNYAATGVWGFSSVSAYNMFYYNAPLFKAYSSGESVDEVRSRLFFEAGMSVEEAKDLDNSQRILAVAGPILKEHSVSYGFFHITHSIKPFFLTSGAKTAAILARDLGDKNYAVPAKPFLLESGIWFVLCVLACGSLIFFRQYRGALLCVLLVGYFFVLTGPVAYSRYRMPASPFIFIAACVTLKNLKNRV